MLNFDWCNNVPEIWARIFIITAFVIPLVFALTMKKAYILKGAKDIRRWRDLRLWVLLLVIIQAVVYVLF